jgi:hypothetical protein
MAETVYILCFIASSAVAYLLLRAYVRTRGRILLWSGLGFFGLCLNNFLLIIDLMVVPTYDLSVIRNLPALGGMCLMLYGLILESD